MTKTLSTLALLAALAVPSVAGAQTPPPEPPPPPPPPPAPAPAQLTLAGTPSGAALVRRSFRVTGRLSPAAPGERVVVRVYRGRRKVLARSVVVAPDGSFRLRLKVRTSGAVHLRASHRQTPAVGTAVAKAVRLDVLPRSVHPGARRAAVRALQHQLARRGYVVGRRGVFDARTARAVLTFRKVSGLRRTSSADRVVMRRLARGGGWFRVRHPGHGKHVEADLSRQVLALVRGRRVERIYPTSSGSPATPTVRGHFRFYMSQPGLNSKEMFHSQYFIGGYAIHGYKSVPVYPASHGCLRVPMEDARTIFNWIDLGDRIDVYA